VWESNLLFTDTTSTHEEALGLSWKDLASFGTLIAALLLPRFLIPLFSRAWDLPGRLLGGVEMALHGVFTPVTM